MSDFKAIDAVCVSEIQKEHDTQRQDQGRFLSKAKTTIGSVDGAEVKRRVVDYVSPQGPGYVVTFYFEKAGRKWRRVVNVGPEGYREMSWFEEEQPKGNVDGARAD